jgi:hypothetical protein
VVYKYLNATLHVTVTSFDSLLFVQFEDDFDTDAMKGGSLGKSTSPSNSFAENFDKEGFSVLIINRSGD